MADLDGISEITMCAFTIKILERSSCLTASPLRALVVYSWSHTSDFLVSHDNSGSTQNKLLLGVLG